MDLLSCPSCHGFVPHTRRVCPHCDATIRAGRWQRLGRVLLRVASGGVMAVTLMACYGGPAYPDACIDYDGDGYFPGCYSDDGITCEPTDPLCDCNDGLPGIHPENGDILGDGIDSDCDGVDGKLGGKDGGTPDATPIPDAASPPPDASWQPDAWDSDATSTDDGGGFADDGGGFADDGGFGDDAGLDE